MYEWRDGRIEWEELQTTALGSMKDLAWPMGTSLSNVSIKGIVCSERMSQFYLVPTKTRKTFQGRSKMTE